MEKKEKPFIHHALGKGLGPNVLGGRVAAVTTDCRKVGRWIEVLVVQLQPETLDDSRENFRVPTPCRSRQCSEAWCVTVFNGPVNVGTVSAAQSQSRGEQCGGRRSNLIYSHVNVGVKTVLFGMAVGIRLSFNARHVIMQSNTEQTHTRTHARRQADTGEDITDTKE